jgi:hypothetical protein
MDRLFEKGYILDPRGKAKSVVLTEEGERGRRGCLGSNPSTLLDLQFSRAYFKTY